MSFLFSFPSVAAGWLTDVVIGNKADERGRLAGIPGLFNELVEGGEDPLTAVRTVACLLAGEERAL